MYQIVKRRITEEMVAHKDVHAPRMQWLKVLFCFFFRFNEVTDFERSANSFCEIPCRTLHSRMY